MEDNGSAAGAAPIDPAVELCAHWHAFADADPIPDSDGFIQRMEAAGLVEWRPVEREDLEDSFAWERGIIEGGMLFALTAAGRAALSKQECEIWIPSSPT